MPHPYQTLCKCKKQVNGKTQLSINPTVQSTHFQRIHENRILMEIIIMLLERVFACREIRLETPSSSSSNLTAFRLHKLRIDRIKILYITLA